MKLRLLQVVVLVALFPLLLFFYLFCSLVMEPKCSSNVFLQWTSSLSLSFLIFLSLFLPVFMFSFTFLDYTGLLFVYIVFERKQFFIVGTKEVNKYFIAIPFCFQNHLVTSSSSFSCPLTGSTCPFLLIFILLPFISSFLLT